MGSPLRARLGWAGEEPPLSDRPVAGIEPARLTRLVLPAARSPSPGVCSSGAGGFPRFLGCPGPGTLRGGGSPVRDPESRGLSLIPLPAHPQKPPPHPCPGHGRRTRHPASWPPLPPRMPSPACLPPRLPGHSRCPPTGAPSPSRLRAPTHRQREGPPEPASRPLRSTAKSMGFIALFLKFHPSPEPAPEKPPLQGELPGAFARPQAGWGLMPPTCQLALVSQAQTGPTPSDPQAGPRARDRQLRRDRAGDRESRPPGRTLGRPGQEGVRTGGLGVSEGPWVPGLGPRGPPRAAKDSGVPPRPRPASP